MFSFMRSLWRFVGSMFGLAAGHTERATDKLLSANPDTIRATFRTTREDLTQKYNSMREAVAELIRVQQMKVSELKQIEKTLQENDQKMTGAIEMFKTNPDERFRQAYAQIADKNETLKARQIELQQSLEVQTKELERYKARLLEFQREIEALSTEEAETVADIGSSQKISELNDRLSGITTNDSTKALEAVRTARKQAVAVGQLSSELSGQDTQDFDRELKSAGNTIQHLSAFDQACGIKVEPQKLTLVAPATESTQEEEVKTETAVG